MKEPLNLKDVRKKIDEIDKELISLFAERGEIVLKVANLKKSKGLPVYDEEREEAVLKKIAMLSEKKNLDPCVMKQIFVLFMAYCRSLEKDYIAEDK